MTIISETFGLGGYAPEHPTGNVVARTVDQGDGTAVVEEWTGKAWRRTDTITLPTPAPLDRESQLVALLAAKGVISTKEASDLTGHSEEKLTAEVEAWAVAEEIIAKR